MTVKDKLKPVTPRTPTVGYPASSMPKNNIILVQEAFEVLGDVDRRRQYR